MAQGVYGCIYELVYVLAVPNEKKHLVYTCGAIASYLGNYLSLCPEAVKAQRVELS
jgi:hypothetical protein